VKELSKAEMEDAEREDRIQRLRNHLDGVDTIYTVLRHVARSGMYRVISLVIIKSNEPLVIDWLAAPLLEGFDKKHYGCRAHGVGMDMGFHLVYKLCQILFEDGYKLNQKWI